MNTHGSQGFTLLELLFTLLIVSVLSLISVWGADSLLTSHRANQRLHTLLIALDKARSLAVVRYQRSGICTMGEDNLCFEDWSAPDLAVFIDANNNHIRDEEEEIVYRIPWSDALFQPSWSNWLARPTIIYQPDGSVVSNGTLLLTNRKSREEIAVIINKSGRPRVERRPGS